MTMQDTWKQEKTAAAPAGSASDGIHPYHISRAIGRADRGASSSIYGRRLPEMQAVMETVLAQIEALRSQGRKTDQDPVEHLLFRLKTEESMREKCRRRGLPETETSALSVLTDAIGIRAVCPFLRDVYTIRDWLIGTSGFNLVQEKDYIKKAKPNGYRSLHLILRVQGYFVEVQLRTISMDTWAALEHQMRYKKDTIGNSDLVARELKRCADELAATDVAMQTMRDLIRGTGGLVSPDRADKQEEADLAAEDRLIPARLTEAGQHGPIDRMPLKGDRHEVIGR